MRIAPVAVGPQDLARPEGQIAQQDRALRCRWKLGHGPGVPAKLRQQRLGLVEGPHLAVGEIGGQRPCLVEQENGFEAVRGIPPDPLDRLGGRVLIRRIDEKALGLVMRREKGVIGIEARREGLESGARRFAKAGQAQIRQRRTRAVQNPQAGEDLCDHAAP